LTLRLLGPRLARWGRWFRFGFLLGHVSDGRQRLGWRERQVPHFFVFGRLTPATGQEQH
jgi:hypothetical protein